MVMRRRHRARSLTVATAILACGLATAAYSAPADTGPAGDPSGTVSVDGRQYEPEPTPQREFEPEPTAPPAPEPVDEPEPAAPPAPEPVDEPEPTATPGPERVDEPAQPAPPAEPAPAPLPAADAPAPDAAPDPPPPPVQDPPVDRPLAVAGSSRPHTGATAPAPGPPGDQDRAEPAGFSARASQPPGSMTPLRSSSQGYDDAVPAPLVAPREDAVADGAPRRRAPRANQAPAGLPELLGSVTPSVGLPRPGAAPGGLAVDRDAPASLLATALAALALAGGGYGGRAAARRRRARRSTS